MQIQPCCATPQLSWVSGRTGDRFADQYSCANCGHIHKNEMWLAPMYLPDEEHCVNCGGELDMSNERPGELACLDCGMTVDESRALHAKLARLHPEGDLVMAAAAASEAGRYVLALKLATAGAVWGEEWQTARALRIQSLEGMGELERALDEAYGWSHGNPAAWLWKLIADLEASAGNPEGSLQALERSLELDHTDLTVWTDYAELLYLIDSRPNAIEAAAYGVADDHLRERCLVLLSEIAERYYQEGDFIGALGAISHAGEWQASYLPMAWMRARIAATRGNVEQAVEWCEVTLRLDPNHAEARHALERIRPPEKKGLFGSLFGGKS